MNIKLIIRSVYLALSLAVIIWLFYNEGKKQETENLIFDKEYSQLLTGDHVNSKVIGVFYFIAGSTRKYPYSSAFMLEDSLKYNVYSYECISHPKIFIDDVIQEGVLLYKPQNSDTLKVSNDREIYYFIIEETSR